MRIEYTEESRKLMLKVVKYTLLGLDRKSIAQILDVREMKHALGK